MIQLVRISPSTTFILDMWTLTCLPTKVVIICENLILLDDESHDFSFDLKALEPSIFKRRWQILRDFDPSPHLVGRNFLIFSFIFWAMQQLNIFILKFPDLYP